MTLGILDRTLNDIAVLPEGEWQQRSWCHCFAGHALRGAGYTDEQVRRIGENYDHVDRNAIAVHAQKLLNLTDDEAAVLFNGDNTYEMLEWIVSDIKRGEVQEWDFYADKADLYV
jgi:hypothetical protein